MLTRNLVYILYSVNCDVHCLCFPETKLDTEGALLQLFLCVCQAALSQQCLELRSQVISLRSQVDTSQTVQRDFVQLSQSLQVRSSD